MQLQRGNGMRGDNVQMRMTAHVLRHLEGNKAIKIAPHLPVYQRIPPFRSLFAYGVGRKTRLARHGFRLLIRTLRPFDT
jgi:hypothetical protein